MTPNLTIYAPLFIASLLFFSWSCYRRLSLVGVGQPEQRFDNPGQRIMGVITYALGQKRVMAKPFGMNHAVIFWAFLVLLAANGEFLIAGLFPGVSLSLLPESLHHILLLAFDIVSILALACVALAACRRLFFAPKYMDTSYASAKSLEAFLILGAIALLMLAYFGLHGTLIALGQEPAAGYMPVSSLFAGVLSAFPAESLHSFGVLFWWVHALVLLLFMNYLPHSKHMHILTAIPNCFFRSLEKTNTQPWSNWPGRIFSTASPAPSAAAARTHARQSPPASRSTHARWCTTSR